MSEEEKKAIEYFKNNALVRIENEQIVASGNAYKVVILNLIDRLQKELEQEKEKAYKKEYFEEVASELQKENEAYKREIELQGYVTLNYISKDKIKELALEIHNILDKNGMTRLYQVLIDSKFEDLLKEN